MIDGFVCGTGDDSLPDAGREMCCMGAAVWGPQRCTCWRPEYSAEQAEPRPGPSDSQPRPCGDCAFRPGSPERSGSEHVRGDQAELDELVAAGQPFYCHAGMRRVLRLVHEPTGIAVERVDAYEPPVLAGVPYQADGTPALVCGGWVALRLAYMQREVS